MAKKWSDAEVALMTAMAGEGAMIKDVAKSLGRSCSSVENKASDIGIKFNLHSAWTDELALAALKLWDDGYSATQIAGEVGMTRNAVIGKLMRIGAQKRGTTKSVITVQRIARDPDNIAKLRERDRIKKQRKRERFKAESRRSLSPGTSKTSPTYRNLLPKAPEMTKNELREMILDAMFNTAMMRPVMEPAE